MSGYTVQCVNVCSKAPELTLVQHWSDANSSSKRGASHAGHGHDASRPTGGNNMSLSSLSSSGKGCHAQSVHHAAAAGAKQSPVLSALSIHSGNAGHAPIVPTCQTLQAIPKFSVPENSSSLLCQRGEPETSMMSAAPEVPTTCVPTGVMKVRLVPVVKPYVYTHTHIPIHTYMRDYLRIGNARV